MNTVNEIIRLVLFIWLMLCALFVWLSIGIIGLLFAFTSNAYLISVIAPWIGLSVVICIIKSAMYVLLKSNPTEYIGGKFNRIKGWLK